MGLLGGGGVSSGAGAAVFLFPQAWCPLQSKVLMGSDPGHGCQQNWCECGFSSHKLCDLGKVASLL